MCKYEKNIKIVDIRRKNNYSLTHKTEHRNITEQENGKVSLRAVGLYCVCVCMFITSHFFFRMERREKTESEYRILWKEPDVTEEEVQVDNNNSQPLTTATENNQTKTFTFFFFRIERSFFLHTYTHKQAMEALRNAVKNELVLEIMPSKKKKPDSFKVKNSYFIIILFLLSLNLTPPI